MRRLLWFLAACAPLACPFPVAADYLVTDLGPGYYTALNDAGQVAGSSSAGPGETYHAYLYSGGTKTDLGLFGGTDTYATALNNAGQVVGYSLSGTTGPQGFLYSQGKMTSLSGLGAVAGINDAGQVVGNTNHATLYGGGVLTDLGTLGGDSSSAAGINASGRVAGWSYTAQGANHAFLYSGGKMTDLGSLGGGSSFAFGLNFSGQVVGQATLPSTIPHAFLYSGGKMIDLGNLGLGASSAYAINNVDQIVGWSSTPSAPKHAFLYTGGKMIDLNTLLPQGTAFTLNVAYAINNRGQILAGSIDDYGHGQGYLLTPDGVSAAPEPSTLTLLALGGAGLLGSRWRKRQPSAC
jgi:probable HAF family extracellular repeat protein